MKMPAATSPKISFCFIIKKINTKNNSLPTDVFIDFSNLGKSIKINNTTLIKMSRII
jgi:hypothetical protein